MDLTEEEVRKTLAILDELEYGEIRLEVGDLRIHLVKNAPGELPVRGAGAALGSAAPALRAPAADPERREVAAVPAAAPRPGLHVIASPAAGVFYRSPAPGQPPFVELGRRIAPGDPLCLIEVMKLFHSVAADVSGTIAEIYGDNGAAVRSDQPLFGIELAP